MGLELKHKDTKTEYLLQIKKNNNLVKDLKNQLQILQTQNQLLKQQSKDGVSVDKTTPTSSPRHSRVNSLSEDPVPLSPKPSLRRNASFVHQRTSSNSSIGSSD